MTCSGLWNGAGHTAIFGSYHRWKTWIQAISQPKLEINVNVPCLRETKCACICISIDITFSLCICVSDSITSSVQPFKKRNVVKLVSPFKLWGLQGPQPLSVRKLDFIGRICQLYHLNSFIWIIFVKWIHLYHNRGQGSHSQLSILHCEKTLSHVLFLLLP